MFASATNPGTLTSSPPFVVLQTLGAAGPSIAALVLTRALHGKEAVRTLIGRFKPLRQTGALYVVAATLTPALAVMAMVINAVVSGGPFVDPNSGLAEMAGEMGWLGAVAVLPVVLASQIFSSPLLEEAGWRGFALPRLQARRSALLASLVLGLAWGLWHLPLVIAYGDPFAPYLAGIMAHTVLMTWVFNSGDGNLFSMLLFHASLNLSLNVLLPLRAGWTPALVALGAAIAVIFLFGHKNLSRHERYAG
ncbi:MAG: CPBP family intramembrane metalloprotease [Coriobacteriia bacterium]|nr:CPBP family intramembrane metalloprotease [Coriobacteriia bacterium]